MFVIHVCYPCRRRRWMTVLQFHESPTVIHRRLKQACFLFTVDRISFFVFSRQCNDKQNEENGDAIQIESLPTTQLHLHFDVELRLSRHEKRKRAWDSLFSSTRLRSNACLMSYSLILVSHNEVKKHDTKNYTASHERCFPPSQWIMESSYSWEASSIVLQSCFKVRVQDTLLRPLLTRLVSWWCTLYIIAVVVKIVVRSITLIKECKRMTPHLMAF